MRLSRLNEVLAVLADNGEVIFDWASCRATLVDRTGNKTIVDKRSYHAFLRNYAAKFNRTETGGTDSKNLVIRWRGQC